MTTAKTKAPTAKMAAAKAKAPASKKVAAQHKAPKKVAPKLPDFSKGRGRPSAASQGLTAKRTYSRTITPEVLVIRRLGEALFGRNWKVDFAPAVKYDSGLVTRILVGTHAVPADMAERIRNALTEQRRLVSEALKSPLVQPVIESVIAEGQIDLMTADPDAPLEMVDVEQEISLDPTTAPAFEKLGTQVWGTYWKRDAAEAIGIDPGLMTNAMKGVRLASFLPSMLQKAVQERANALASLRNDPYLTPASPGETQKTD